MVNYYYYKICQLVWYTLSCVKRNLQRACLRDYLYLHLQLFFSSIEHQDQNLLLLYRVLLYHPQFPITKFFYFIFIFMQYVKCFSTNYHIILNVHKLLLTFTCVCIRRFFLSIFLKIINAMIIFFLFFIFIYNSSKIPLFHIIIIKSDKGIIKCNLIPFLSTAAEDFSINLCCFHISESLHFV